MKKFFDPLGNELIPIKNEKMENIVTGNTGGLIGMHYSYNINPDDYDYIVSQKPIKEIIISAKDANTIKQISIFHEMPIAYEKDNPSNVLKQSFYINIITTAGYYAHINAYTTSNVTDTITSVDYIGGNDVSPNSGTRRVHYRIYGVVNLDDNENVLNYYYIILNLLEINGEFQKTGTHLSSGAYRVNQQVPNILSRAFNNVNWIAYGIKEAEFDNSNTTDIGGGYGLGSMPTDNINIPSLPTINMSDTGSTLYSLTALQMKNFRTWLWTTDWVENLKKIRTDPMQNIIGISIVDVPISSVLNALIYVGNVASTVEANVISNSFVELDCGEITLDEYYGSFADYEPFIATTLYLPKVGFVQIPADVCVNNTIKVVYHIELSSGEGLCYVQLTSKRDGFKYIWNTYTCHVTSNITLSAQDHSQQLVALGNAIINAGISASNAIVNPASIPQGLTSTLSSCIDVATTKNPTSTKGNVGNMSAVMCYKKPYLLINRTNLTKPSSFQENNGYLINYTAKINEHTGFLKTRDFHAEFNAPYNHKVEIEKIMDEGVFING